MGDRDPKMMLGAGQIGTRMRRILAASGRNGSVRCVGSGDTQSALSAHGRGFLARLPADGLGGQRYELTPRGAEVLEVLKARGMIDADGC